VCTNLQHHAKATTRRYTLVRPLGNATVTVYYIVLCS